MFTFVSRLRRRQGLGTPVLVHLNLGDAFRESMSVSPMDLDVGDDLILGWDWISSHNLRHLYQAYFRSGSAQLQLALLPPAARPPPATLSTVIGHGEFRRLIRQIVRDDPSASSATDRLRCRRDLAARTRGRRAGHARHRRTTRSSLHSGLRRWRRPASAAGAVPRKPVRWGYGGPQGRYRAASSVVLPGRRRTPS
jgi:hypothetical protein